MQAHVRSYSNDVGDATLTDYELFPGVRLSYCSVHMDRLDIGDAASFEFILDLNPDYIFVMDRDAAIGASEGVQTAREIMENELVMSTDAYKNGHQIILAHPAAWYTGEGGITALDIMLQDLEEPLLGR